MPDRPYLHQMSGAAPQNEHSEHPENPVERKIFAAPQQIDQGKRDAVVGEGDNAIRYNVQPHDLGVPQVAGPMGQEIGRKQLGEKSHLFCGRCLANLADAGWHRKALEI